MIKGLLLFMFALVTTLFFSVVFIPVSIVYHVFLPMQWVTGWSRAGKFLHQMALSIDQFANVSLQTIFNLIMIKNSNRNKVVGEGRKLKESKTTESKWVWERYYKFDFTPFGDEDDTLSYVFAKNYYHGSLSSFGRVWAWVLNAVDKNHLLKAVDAKEKRDIEALCRLIESGRIKPCDLSNFKIA